MTPPREVWVVVDRDGDVYAKPTEAEAVRMKRTMDTVLYHKHGDDSPMFRYTLPPSLLTEAQREQLARGIDRSLKRGVKGVGGPLEVLRLTLQDIIGPHALMNAHAGGAWMRTLAYWLLAQDDRIRGTG